MSKLPRLPRRHDIVDPYASAPRLTPVDAAAGRPPIASAMRAIVTYMRARRDLADAATRGIRVQTDRIRIRSDVFGPSPEPIPMAPCAEAPRARRVSSATLVCATSCPCPDETRRRVPELRSGEYEAVARASRG